MRGSFGGYRGGPASHAGRSFYGGMRGGAMSPQHGFSGSRPWSWEGHSTRNVAPGWHSFANSGNSARLGTTSPARGTPATAGRSFLSGRYSGGAVTSHAVAADGQWHSFGGSRAVTASRSVSSMSSVRTGTVYRQAGFVSHNMVWHGGWHGSGWHGWGWHGWDWPGWNWGWGCCGWGWGIGFGWGWGGWAAWGPFWAWPPYWYNPWLYAYEPPPMVLYPYPG